MTKMIIFSSERERLCVSVSVDVERALESSREIQRASSSSRERESESEWAVGRRSDWSVTKLCNSPWNVSGPSSETQNYAAIDPYLNRHSDTDTTSADALVVVSVLTSSTYFLSGVGQPDLLELFLLNFQ